MKDDLKYSDTLITFLVLIILSIFGVILGPLFFGGFENAPVKMVLGMGTGATIMWLSELDTPFGRFVNDEIVNFGNFVILQPIGSPCGAAIVGAFLPGFIIATITHDNDLLDLPLFVKSSLDNPSQSIIGAIFCVAIFLFRKQIMGQKSWSNWTYVDIFIIIKRKSSNKWVTMELEGVLQECPTCHKKQILKNSECSCGVNLLDMKKSGRIKYWFESSIPNGRKQIVFIGNSLSVANRKVYTKYGVRP